MKGSQDEETIKVAIQSLINSYQQELSEYQKILKLTKEQKQFIENDEWENLNKIITDKNKVIKKINRVEEKIVEVKKNLAANLDLQLGEEFYPQLIKMELPRVDKLKEVIISVYHLMKKINELDQENKTKLEKKKKQKQQRSQKIKHGLNINRAYRGYTDSSEGKFFDQTD